MEDRSFTITLLVALTSILIFWDVIVAIRQRKKKPGDGATVSEVVLGWAKAHPVFPFAVGVVCGHLLWPQVRDVVHVETTSVVAPD